MARYVKTQSSNNPHVPEFMVDNDQQFFQVSTDGTLGNDSEGSDSKLPTEKAVKQYVDSNSVSGTVQTVSVQLTDEQIKALPTIYVQILPAPGANKVNHVLGGFIVTNFTAGAYTNVDDSGVINGPALFYQAGVIRNIIYTGAYWVFEDDSEAGYISIIPRFEGYVIGEEPEMIVEPVSISDYRSGVVNTPIMANYNNGSGGNLTGGNAANTLTVTLFYIIADI